MHNSEEFLSLTQCDTIEPMAGDMSPRRYYRGQRGGQTLVIMRYPQVDHDSLDELHTFIRIGQWLNEQGLKAPALYNLYEHEATAVFEDLGGTSFGQALRGGHDAQELYTLGCDVLKHIKGLECPDDLPDYADGLIHYNRRQLIDWYVPQLEGVRAPAELMPEYLEAWNAVEAPLDPCPQGFVHLDFHLENLMLVEGEEGLKRCGLIDFQGGCKGPLPYDLLNLLEDARVDVPDDIRHAMIDRYCEGMSESERQTFMDWYAVLKTQFHCRVLGLFIYQFIENGRPDYLPHVPRLQKYIADGLDHPVLAPLKVWFAKESIDFSVALDLNGNA